MSWKSIQQVAAVLGAAAITTALLQACNPPPPPGKKTVDRPECPSDFIVVPSDTGRATTTTVIAGSGPISLVPEFHDCQRFTDSARTRFGSMIAIFASYRLDTVPDPVPPPPNAPPVAVSVVGSDRAAATILNYDEPYPPLHIARGFNCLYMFTVNGLWQAAIVSATSDSACVHPMGTAGGAPLAVSVVTLSKGQTPPPVARWDWDATAGEHYIGIRCGTRWCEVSDPARGPLQSSAKYAGSPLVAVKGWYDEQYLAVAPASGGGLVPGGVLATIFPVGDLAKNTLDDFKEWRQVALVSLSDDSPEYLAKFNFRKGPAPLGNSEVWMCRGTLSACGIPSSAPVNTCDNTADLWWAKIVSGDAKTTYRCVIRRTHTGVDIPGAARWRWKVQDEGMWVRCPAGCCEVT